MNKRPKSLASKSNIRHIDPDHPELSLICEAADVVKRGGVVVFPTRTLYGMGVDAFNAEAVNQVFCVKQRLMHNPLSVLIKSVDAVTSLAAEIPSAAVKFMETFWPGRVTIVFKARPDVPSNLTAGTSKIGIRVPEHPVAVKLVVSLDHPLTGTSANLSGDPGADCIEDLSPEIIKGVNLVIDSGTLKGGIGSTVVDVTTDPPTIIREGEVSQKELFRIL
ncbi:MAG: threonylcarbamoyl-AMP synthase [Desulfobacteraceae bacterium]|nr:threonylcarbamoyl-AMP synthase [Desulfobacteraceae bacterium]MBC2756604.1 threonylcarbamoyl-AMP synthase [Desulfobacteraceae bacterium]